MIAPAYAELRRLLAEATPGPVTAIVEKFSATIRSPSGCIAEVFAPNLPELEPNAKLFAAMRNALPALLAEAEAGRKLRATIGEAVAWNTVAATAPGACADYDREVGT